MARYGQLLRGTGRCDHRQHPRRPRRVQKYVISKGFDFISYTDNSVWLEKMRAKYAARQSALEEHVYEIRDRSVPDNEDSEPDSEDSDTLARRDGPTKSWIDLVALPSELPPPLEIYDAAYFYIINLDSEVLTLNYGVHWKLGNIPRRNRLWMKAIRDSIYPEEPTISLDICLDAHIASPALELPKPNLSLGYRHRIVAPKLDIGEARKAFLTRFLADVLVEYGDRIIKLGMEWSPVSFPFRELTFALVSIASDTARFFSFPARRCRQKRHPRRWRFHYLSDDVDRYPRLGGFFDKEWAGNHAPLLEFGFMSHLPGDASGVSPAETMYWHEDVLVSLTLRPDGEAITQAVSWGLDQGRKNFQIVVLSLFEVAFAEVRPGKGTKGKPLVKISKPIYLSPLRHDFCMSTHPRERPELKDGMRRKHRRERGEVLTNDICTGTVRRLQSQFPGLAALVNFFEVATNRRVASKSAGILPPELCDQILEYVDYDTWRACTSVSTKFRYSCLRKYRVDDETRIVAGPFVRLRSKTRKLSFEFENMKTGQVFPVMENWEKDSFDWMPLIGNNARKALMLDVAVAFLPAVDISVENDSDDEVTTSRGPARHNS
ncbi:hypothetical protein F4680DRAFT_438595 [Xylaria scruposa]|nr:hypothetical protein F4680DRAFT_438595 [Xylaria scruposa]